jgi:hypothetical protein
MASKYAPRRPPDHFVPVSRASWQALCDALEGPIDATELRHGARMVGFHKWRVWAVDPDAFRELVGTWPPGYWPG